VSNGGTCRQCYVGATSSRGKGETKKVSWFLYRESKKWF